MNDNTGYETQENTQPNGPGASQMSAEQWQTPQHFTSLAYWQTNPAALAEVVHKFLQQQGSGLSATFSASSVPDGVHPNSNPMGIFPRAGSHWQAGTTPQAYPQPFQQSAAGTSHSSANFSAGVSLAAEMSRLNYTSPIPPSRDCDAVVASRLRQADKDKKSYKDALREMHTVFDYPSNLWIDYYLDRRVIIDELIDESERRASVRIAKQPGIDGSAGTTDSTSAPSTHPGSASMKEKGASSSSLALKQRRATLNSMAALYDQTPDPKNDAIPDPPSREPTPPTEIRSLGVRGNAFTDADVKYLVDFVNWVCANKDWSVTKMYKKLYKRAPHHSAASWAGKARTMPIVAKIIDASEQDEEEEEEEEDANNQDMDVDEAADAEHSSLCGRRRQVGGIGTAITDDDFEEMADWIVKNEEEWQEMSGRMRWFSFAEKHNKRSWQAWAEAYRRYRADVDSLVEKRRRCVQASRPSGGKRPRID